MRKSERRPTLKDVAALCGVSVISVSRIMRNSPNISVELREKVETAARSLGYQRNRIDEALKDSPLQPVLGMSKYNDANDDLAIGALFYCQSIVPRLTTISTPRFEMGRLAGEMIQLRAWTEYWQCLAKKSCTIWVESEMHFLIEIFVSIQLVPLPLGSGILSNYWPFPGMPGI